MIRRFGLREKWGVTGWPAQITVQKAWNAEQSRSFAFAMSSFDTTHEGAALITGRSMVSYPRALVRTNKFVCCRAAGEVSALVLNAAPA
jgi:hypothetical protein